MSDLNKDNKYIVLIYKLPNEWIDHSVLLLIVIIPRKIGINFIIIKHSIFGKI